MPTVSEKQASEFIESKVSESTAGLSFGPPVDVTSLAEDFIAYSQRMRAQAETPRKPMTGNVRVTKQAGLITSIEIDEQWARARSARIIVDAILAEANRHEPDRPENDMLFAAMSVPSRLTERS